MIQQSPKATHIAQPGCLEEFGASGLGLAGCDQHSAEVEAGVEVAGSQLQGASIGGRCLGVTTQCGVGSCAATGTTT